MFSRNETSARVEEGWRRSSRLKEEERRFGKPLTFVIEFSPSAISVPSTLLTTSSLCFSSSLELEPLFYPFPRSFDESNFNSGS